MDTDLVLRRFDPADAPDLTALLHRAYAGLGGRGLNFTAVDQDEATTLRRAGGGQSWVLTQAGRLVATMTMTLPPGRDLQTLSVVARRPGTAWLNQLAVDPRLRGRGLASRLWRTGREWALSRGAPVLGLDTAAPATELVELYAGWGFVERETIRWPGKTYASVVMTCSPDDVPAPQDGVPPDGESVPDHGGTLTS